jgi:hypothetical protein
VWNTEISVFFSPLGTSSLALVGSERRHPVSAALWRFDDKRKFGKKGLPRTRLFF